MNAHSFKKKNKPTQGYFVFGLPVRGDMLYIFPNTKKEEKDFFLILNLLAVIQWVNRAWHGFSSRKGQKFRFLA